MTIITGKLGAAPTNEERGTDRTRPLEEQRQLATLYDGNKAAKPLPVDAGEFYGHPALAGEIDRRKSELWDQTGTGEADHAALRRQFLGIAKQTGLPEGALTRIAAGHIDGLLAEARVPDDVDADEVAADQRVVADTNTTREELTTLYGQKDAEDLIRRTQRFVRMHPSLQKVLQRNGLGSRPAIVRDLVAHVFSTGYGARR